MKIHSQNIEVPKCWKDLIKVEFPEDLVGITSEKHCTGVDDPHPHYDDFREIRIRFSDGTVGVLQLSSGQGNYYGSIFISCADGWWADSDPLESWNDKEEELVVNDVKYVFVIKWV